MYYKIDDIKTDARVSEDHPFARLIVYVSFWLTDADQKAGKLPQWREGFYMDAAPTFTRIVRNDDGWPQLADGTFIDPAKIGPLGKPLEYTRETLKTDVPAMIRENIERHISRLGKDGKRGAHFDKDAQPSLDDAKAVLALPEVAAMKDADPVDTEKKA